MASRARMRTRAEIGNSVLASLSGNELLLRRERQGRQRIFGRKAFIGKENVNRRAQARLEFDKNHGFGRRTDRAREKEPTRYVEKKRVSSLKSRKKGKSHTGKADAKSSKRVTFSLPPKRKKVVEKTESSVDVMSEQFHIASFPPQGGHRITGSVDGNGQRQLGRKYGADGGLVNRHVKKSTPEAILLPIVSVGGESGIVHESAVSWARSIAPQSSKPICRISRVYTVWAPPDKSMFDF